MSLVWVALTPHPPILLESIGKENNKKLNNTKIAFEKLAKSLYLSNPDVIIIVTMGIAGEKEKKTWQRFNTLNAAKNNRIYIVDSYKMCSPTPVSFADTLEMLVEIFHPEYKEERKIE